MAEIDSVSKSRSMTSSSILSIIGGSLMITAGIFALWMFSILNQSWMPGLSWRMMMSGYYFVWAAGGTMAGVSLAIGALAVVGGYAIYVKPASASVWGTGILIASIVGLVTTTGGFFIGPVLGIIGGILALTKK